MIRLLYSNTVSRGVPKHVWSPKQTDVHFANAWIQAVIEHPEKGIFIKNCGLQFLEEKDFDAFANFDIIYTHLIPIHDIGKFKWHEFPALIKDRLGDRAPKVMMSIDNEMAHVPPSQEVKKAMDAADLLICVTKLCLDRWGEYTSTPISYVPAPKYYQQVMEPLPYDKREKIVAIMRHTWVPSDEKTGIRTQLQVAKRLGCKVRLFTGWFNEQPEKMLYWAKNQGVTLGKCEGFTRLGRIPYLEKLRECYVGIEDEYIGASRFAAECACLKIPVVGNEYVTGAAVANPDLLTERRNVDGKVGLIQRLFDDRNFYIEQCELAYKNIIEHYDAGVCLDRMKKAWKDAGLI